MGLSSLPAPSEGVLLVFLVNTALSISLFKEIVRSILYMVGIRPPSQPSDAADARSDPFEFSPFVEEFRCRVPAVRFGAFLGRPKEEDCSVCLTRFEPESEINRLGCGHLFHRACLEKWLGYWNATCPLCRSPLLPLGDDSLASCSSASRIWF